MLINTCGFVCVAQRLLFAELSFVCTSVNLRVNPSLSSSTTGTGQAILRRTPFGLASKYDPFGLAPI